MADERKVINQAQIDAANAARAAAQKELAAARARETTFGTANAQTILENIRRTTTAIQGATKALQKSPSSSKTLKTVQSARGELGATKTAMSPLVTEYKGIQADILGAESTLAGITVPAPQYETQAVNAILEALMASLAAVGVEGLAPVMAQIRKDYPDISSADALMLLKFDPRYNKPYMTRFSGNQKRMEAGFAPLDDREYLANEAAYNKIFTAYGITQFANRTEYARQIGNRVAPEELAEKVSNTYERVIKGAAETVRATTQLFPELTDKDLLAYALDPTTQLPALKRKIQAAEIGGAALAQSLTTGLTAAAETKTGYSNVVRKGLGVEELIAQGVSLESARRGYQTVAELLPTAEKLSAIYGGRMDQYGRLQAEQEVFQELASARRAREKITAAELAAFSAEPGRGAGALGKERFV